jgi:pimeloyl-ACP methyl ester carboxylesterase
VLSYERVGHGEPLVLVHGISHQRSGWSPVVARLAQHHEVILVDLPGHGASPAFDPGDLTIRSALTGLLQEFLDDAGLDRPHVAGNSLGALVALEMAEQGMARSVTALAPAGFWYGAADFAYVRALFATVQLAARTLEPVAPRLLSSRLGRAFAFGWAAAHPTRIDAEAALADLRNMVASKDAIGRMFTGAYCYDGHGADVPTTIAWGTRDLVLLPYQALRARHLLVEAEHVWLPGCGHVPMTDDPDLVVRTILNCTGRATAPSRIDLLGA